MQLILRPQDGLSWPFFPLDLLIYSDQQTLILLETRLLFWYKLQSVTVFKPFRKNYKIDKETRNPMRNLSILELTA